MVRLIAALAMVMSMSLLGCGLSAPSGEPVELLTAPAERSGCYTFQVTDTLVTDARYGTLIQHYGIPVMWPAGYTGQRLSSGEIVVLDASQNVVATTGHRYTIKGGGETVAGVSAFVACPYGVTEVTE